MSQEPSDKPSRRLLLLAGTAALGLAAFVAAKGLADRASTHQELTKWASSQSVPTVQLAKLDHGSGTSSVTLPGTIQPFYKALIYARVSGYLKSWQADIGASVKTGQVLASVDTPELDQQFDQARADLATAQANEQLAVLTAKRWHALLGSQSVSRQAADEKAGDAAAKKAMVDASAANLRRLQALESFKSVVAPFDGIVTARNTDVGALINAGSAAGQPLFEVSDLHKVRIYVEVPQAVTAQLRPGMKASFEMPQYPGRKFDAVLVTTSSALHAASRSMLVELQADNPDGTLFPGSYCQVQFQVPDAENGVQVPATALVPVDHGAQLAVLVNGGGNGGTVVFKTVQLGRDLGDKVEVTAGLSPSDRVIDSPPETLQNGDTIRVAD